MYSFNPDHGGIVLKDGIYSVRSIQTWLENLRCRILFRVAPPLECDFLDMLSDQISFLWFEVFKSIRDPEVVPTKEWDGLSVDLAVGTE